jgi:hypothetical protein
MLTRCKHSTITCNGDASLSQSLTRLRWGETPGEPLPTREVYVKGPGLIFKGNPKNYLTEIQLPFKD